MLASLMAALAVMLAAAPVRAQSAPGAPVFVENAGQWDTPARFVLRSGGLTARFEPDGLWLDQRRERDDGTAEGAALHWTFEGASPEVQLVGEQRASGVHRYLLGNDRSAWRTDVRLYNAVRYQGLYPGVDLLLRWQGGHLEYDLRLFPGADLGQVAIRSQGGRGFRMEPDGTLLLDTALGPLRQARPLAWEIDGSGARRPVTCDYVKHGGDMFGFSVPDRDPSRALVIDPGLEWAASLGGSVSEAPRGLVLGDDGRVYFCGTTSSPDFPTTPGAISNQLQGYSNDAFVSCLGDDGQTLLFSTYLGGGPIGSTSAWGIALAGRDEPVVVGWTSAATFPVTPGVVGPVKSGIIDAFVTRLNTSGSDVVFSTFYGGSLGDSGQLASDRAYAVAVGGSGIITVAGTTSTSDYPTTPGAFQELKTPDDNADGFVLRLSADASQVIYSTFLGGTGFDQVNDIALFPSGEVVVVGWGADPPVTPGAFDTTPDLFKSDGYVAKLSADGSRLVYGTFLGGIGNDRASAVAAGPNGEAVVVGETYSIDFPVTPGAWDSVLNFGTTSGRDAFVTRLDATGCCLLYSTYFGGGGDELDFDVALQSSGAITIAGTTWSSSFPTTPGAFQSVKGGTFDAFVARIHPSGRSLVYSTYLGGSLGESKIDSTHVALDPTGAAIVTGTTNSPDFPLTPGTIQSDPVTFGPVFVAKLDLLATGVSKLGASTPGSGAPLAIGAISMPQVGHDGFAVSCTDAPPLAAGILAVSFAPLQDAALLKGAGLWLDPTAFIALAPQTSDATGYSQARLAVPDDPRLEGLAVYAQYLWPDPVQAGLLVASNALEIVVQS